MGLPSRRFPRPGPLSELRAVMSCRTPPGCALRSFTHARTPGAPMSTGFPWTRRGASLRGLRGCRNCWHMRRSEKNRSSRPRIRQFNSLGSPHMASPCRVHRVRKSATSENGWRAYVVDLYGDLSRFRRSDRSVCTARCRISRDGAPDRRRCRSALKSRAPSVAFVSLAAHAEIDTPSSEMSAWPRCRCSARPLSGRRKTRIQHRIFSGFEDECCSSGRNSIAYRIVGSPLRGW